MGMSVAQKLIESHLVEGKMIPGDEIGIKIDQTLTQDATGTMCMLELEAMGVARVKTELSAQYVDHNLVQADFRTPDDHLFLMSACERFGIWYSRPGNGVSHPVHMERFGVPGKTLLGSDSHTPAAGSLGMLAVGAGGLKVAMAMAGEPFYLTMPKIMGVTLTGKMPEWVSAKDLILEMLRRHGVAGGVNRIIEYHGPGLESLTAMDRHVIANMGAELGATTSVFPSDGAVRAFLEVQEREDEWHEILADDNAVYDEHDTVDLGGLEPLVACPGSPGNVVPLSEVAGREIHQSYIGSSANPGFRDFAVPAMIVDGRKIHDNVSFDINPTSRQVLEKLIAGGYLQMLVHAGARVHQPGCNGCIGMGQAPATGTISLRTVPRNFPGRSGTSGDNVYLCSPETAAVSALSGKITDPRTADMACPRIKEPESILINTQLLVPPAERTSRITLRKGPNIRPLPSFRRLPENLAGPVLLKVGDDVSTDEILPAGSNILPFRSNIPEISRFVFERIDNTFYDRALSCRETGSFVVGGDNYGQGSSREHAVLAPRYLGVRAVIAKGFARIYWENLCNFGVLPLVFVDAGDYDAIEQEDVLEIAGVRGALEKQQNIPVYNKTRNATFEAACRLSRRQIEMILSGSLVNMVRRKMEGV